MKGTFTLYPQQSKPFYIATSLSTALTTSCSSSFRSGPNITSSVTSPTPLSTPSTACTTLHGVYSMSVPTPTCPQHSLGQTLSLVVFEQPVPNLLSETKHSKVHRTSKLLLGANWNISWKINFFHFLVYTLSHIKPGIVQHSLNLNLWCSIIILSGHNAAVISSRNSIRGQKRK